MRDMEHQRQIIDTFVNSVYVFDDRVVLNFNFTDDSKTISREEVLGSSAVDNAPPRVPRPLVWGLFSWWAVQDSNYFSPDTGRKRTKAGYHHEGGILPFESLCGKPAYSSGMPALAQASRVAASQTLACTSPMWALPSSSMHRRLWPMPPPME